MPKSTTATLPELLDSEQLAAVLGVSMKSLYSSHQRGHIPRGTKIPGVGGLRWRKTDIAKWLDEQMTGAA